MGLEKKKSILGIIGIIVIAIGLGSLFFFEGIDSGETIKIGVTLPITGAAGNMGEPMTNGMQFAVGEMRDCRVHRGSKLLVRVIGPCSCG